MKRQHYQFHQQQQQQQQQQQHSGHGLRGGNLAMAASGSKGKEAVVYSNKDSNGGMGVDKELASMGYSVKSSDLLQVAQRLEQLEMVMCSAQEDGISHLSSEAVHYNPSDLAGWIESMLTELNVPNTADHHLDQSSTAREASNSVPESSTSTSRPDRSVEQRVDHFGTGVAPGLYDGLDGSEFLQDYMDQMVGLFSQNSDPSEALLINPGSSSLMEQDHHQALPTRDEPSPPSTVLIPSSSNSSLEVQSRDQQHLQQQHHQQPQAQDDLDVTGGRRQKKRPRSEPEADRLLPSDRPMVMGADPQESGVRLVHMLMACAEAVQESRLAVAGKMVKDIRIMACNQGGAMGKVATYFAEALARRIYGFLPQDALLNHNDSLSEFLQFHFYETCPYLKFAHFTANQAILEAFAEHKRVHVIDFNLKQGMQWPALIQALALRPGGPPAFRLTGIGPQQPDGSDVLQEVGMKLAHLAESINVEFSFRGYVASNLSNLKPWMLDIKPGVEAVAVNSILQLHRLIDDDPSQQSSSIDQVLAMVRSLNPKIVTVVEQEADHNQPIFLDRFTEALHYYSTIFDSLEACRLPPESEQQVMSEIYLGREICNIVACEGPERVERHEPLMQWRVRLYNAGFRAMHLGSNAFKQASMLLTLFQGGEGYRVEENNGCLTLGWHSRPLIAASAWQCSS